MKPGLAGLSILAFGLFHISVAPPNIPAEERTEPLAAWARVLRDFVDPAGHIDFARMIARPRDLFIYVAYVAEVSPRNRPDDFPDPPARLAYYLNAYNALAMYNVVTQPVEPKDKIRFFRLRQLKIGGEEMSLSSLENDLIRPLGEPRVHFALNCMVRGCPHLPRVPFEPTHLEEQLDTQAREFLNDPTKVRVSPTERKVRLSKILDWYKADFLKKAPTLVDYVNRFRSEALPKDFAVEFLDYDWTLNRTR